VIPRLRSRRPSSAIDFSKLTFERLPPDPAQPEAPVPPPPLPKPPHLCVEARRQPGSIRHQPCPERPAC
jgi:hypothetical protein